MTNGQCDAFVTEEKIHGSTLSRHFAGNKPSAEEPAKGYATTRIKGILSELEHYTGVFPREALASAIQERDQIVPDLLDIIRRAADNPHKPDAEPDYMGHVYAIRNVPIVLIPREKRL